MTKHTISKSGSISVNKGYYTKDGMDKIQFIEKKEKTFNSAVVNPGFENHVVLTLDNSGESSFAITDSSTTELPGYKACKSLDKTKIYLDPSKTEVLGTNPTGIGYKVRPVRIEREIFTYPDFTSKNTYGTVTDRRNNTSESQEGWRVFQNTTSSYSPNYSSEDWWKWELPAPIIVESGVSYIEIIGNTNYAARQIQFFADEACTIPFTNLTTVNSTSAATVRISANKSLTTNIIYAKIGTASTWSEFKSWRFVNFKIDHEYQGDITAHKGWTYSNGETFRLKANTSITNTDPSTITDCKANVYYTNDGSDTSNIVVSSIQPEHSSEPQGYVFVDPSKSYILGAVPEDITWDITPATSKDVESNGSITLSRGWEYQDGKTFQIKGTQKTKFIDDLLQSGASLGYKNNIYLIPDGDSDESDFIISNSTPSVTHGTKGPIYLDENKTKLLGPSELEYGFNVSVPQGIHPNVEMVGGLKSSAAKIYNFSQNNYAVIDAPTSTVTSYEMVIKFFPLDLSPSYIFGKIDANTQAPRFISSDGTTSSFAHPTDSSGSMTTINSGALYLQQWQWLKATWNGSTITVSRSTDGISYSTIETASASSCAWNGKLVLGSDGQEGGISFNGEFDLSECYININGETFWEGSTGSFLVPYCRVVGNPTCIIEDNKATISGFSTSNYLIAPMDNQNYSRGFECQWCFRPTAEDLASTYAMICDMGAGYTNNINGGTLRLMLMNGYLRLGLMNDGANTWNWIASMMNYTLKAGILYFVKMVFDGSQYNVFISMNDDNNYEKIYNIEGTYPRIWNVAYIGVDCGGASPFHGELLLHHWYIKINGKIVWTPMIQQGTLNVDILGSPSVSEGGIASNFSAANTLKIPVQFDPQDNPFEVVIRYNVRMNESTYFFGSANTAAGSIYTPSRSLMIGYTGSRTVSMWLASSAATTGWDISSARDISAINSGFTYFKVSYDLTTYKLEYSYDGITWGLIAHATSSTRLAPGTFYLGGCWDAASKAGTSEFDLSKCYIKVGDEYIWRGIDVINQSRQALQVSTGYKYINETNGYYNISYPKYRSIKKAIVHPEDFVIEQPKVPNYNIVGETLMVDEYHIASGFDANNYITLPTVSASATANTVLSMTVVVPPEPRQMQLIHNTNCELLIASDKRLLFWNSQTGNRYSNVPVPTDEPVTIQLAFLGSSAEMRIIFHGELLSSVSLPTTRLPSGVTTLGLHGSSHGNAFSGLMFLDELYVMNMEGEKVWNAYEVVKTPQFNIVGSPTITDGIGSGFTTTDYIEGYHFDPGSQPWEICTRVNVPNYGSSSGRYFFGYHRNDPYGIVIGSQGNTMGVYLSSTSVANSWDIATIKVLTYSYGVYILVKLEFTGSQYILSISENEGATWSSHTINNSRIIKPGTLLFGSSFGAALASGGTLDLNHTYVKINGQTVWTPYVAEGAKAIGYASIVKNSLYDSNIVITGHRYPSASYVGSLFEPYDLATEIELETNLEDIINVEKIE